MHSLLPHQQGTSSSASSSSSQLLLMVDRLCADQLSAGPTDGQFAANCLYGFAHMRAPAPQLFDALVARAASPSYCK